MSAILQEGCSPHPRQHLLMLYGFKNDSSTLLPSFQNGLIAIHSVACCYVWQHFLPSFILSSTMWATNHAEITRENSERREREREREREIGR